MRAIESTQEAFDVLDEAAGLAPGTRAEHIRRQQSVQYLQEVILQLNNQIQSFEDEEATDETDNQ